ncbi:hypothetical protein [Limosilactobacillus sp. c10Ua_36]|uniref:hypothetical protein n=1 Tax=Limosilactobacillus sp. c10Ua_36 TaxID=2775910 RepID=UPI001781B629|nr:hypothetical protein [Limosilactobacillus sp. c10Ua_36]MEC4742816.1 hypothetical protein [Limosilactobacillus sp. c10Ua_36]
MVTPLKTLMGFSVYLNVQLKFYNLPYKKVVKLGNQEFNNRFPYLFQEEMETENSLTLRFIRNIYVHGIIDILVLWGNSNNSIGIDDVKRLLGLVQTKSPVELMKLYQIEMDRFH